MSDLRVDYIILEDAERKLSDLKSELDGLKNRVEDTEDLWCHDGVRDAMHEFGTNMGRNRDKLSETLQAVGERVSNTLEAFRDTETELVKAWDEAK